MADSQINDMPYAETTGSTVAELRAPWLDSPCFGCGLCCRYFRVSFFFGEVDSQPGGYVPEALVTPISPFRVCMKGTEQGGSPCVAQQADGGCAIYENRPSTCRDFPMTLPSGEPNPECLRLKRIFGLIEQNPA